MYTAVSHNDNKRNKITVHRLVEETEKGFICGCGKNISKFGGSGMSDRQLQVLKRNHQKMRMFEFCSCVN